MTMEQANSGNSPRDPDLIGAEAAIHRAARRAKQRAERVARAYGAVPSNDSDGTAESDLTETTARDPRTLTFSQAQGYAELPGPLNLEELPVEARMRIWNLFYRSIQTEVRHSRDEGSHFRGDSRWPDILFSVHLDHYVLAQDDWDLDIDGHELRKEIGGIQRSFRSDSIRPAAPVLPTFPHRRHQGNIRRIPVGIHHRPRSTADHRSSGYPG